MISTKFVVKVSRSGGQNSQYVRSLNRTPILMTPDRKLALLMGRLTAEDAVNSIQSSRCTAELIPVAIKGRPATA